MFAATIGFFDGVHKGHRYLIEQMMSIAKDRNLHSMIITFEAHPRTVLHADYIPQLLTTLEEKELLLNSMNPDRLEVLKFDKAMSCLSAKEFMKDILHDKLGVSVLLMGYDHRFGHGGGTEEEYQQWGKECGIEVIKAKELEGTHASSSQCRLCLAMGDISGAQDILGYPYILSGRVVGGHQIGRQIGFPTANISTIRDKIIPACGVYAVYVITSDGQRHGGVLNIGRRPTLNNGDNITIEVNILDFCDNLYEQEITLEFVARLRGETTFPSIEDLQRQIEQDIEKAREIVHSL